MVIAFVVGLYPYQIGGAEMQAQEIAIALQKKGYIIHYICYSSRSYASKDFNVSIIPINRKLDFFYYGTRKNLFNVLDKIRPDIVYHRAFVPYSRFIAQWCTNNYVPFFFHSADIYTLTRKNSSLYNVISNIWLRYTLKKATGVICQNIEQYEALSKFSIKKVKIIYNMQCKNTSPINLRKDNNIVWIAKFEPAKQPEIFIELAERFKNTDVKFTMFSSKCPNTPANRQLLEKINKNSQITLMEDKDNVYINDYLCNTASILVNTSVSEGISNTFIQSWMRGVPVVSLNSNPDGWFDKYKIGGCCNGIISKLDYWIKRILDEKEYCEYSKKSQEFADRFFSPEMITPQLVEFMNL